MINCPYLFFKTNRIMPTANNQLTIVNSQLSIVNCQLITAPFVVAAVYHTIGDGYGIGTHGDHHRAVWLRLGHALGHHVSTQGGVLGLTVEGLLHLLIDGMVGGGRNLVGGNPRAQCLTDFAELTAVRGLVDGPVGVRVTQFDTVTLASLFVHLGVDAFVVTVHDRPLSFSALSLRFCRGWTCDGRVMVRFSLSLHSSGCCCRGCSLSHWLLQ